LRQPTRRNPSSHFAGSGDSRPVERDSNVELGANGAPADEGLGPAVLGSAFGSERSGNGSEGLTEHLSVGVERAP
jgi:hypothetical protein